MEYEWVVRVDGEPSSFVSYRGPDEARAREELRHVVPVAGWGAVLTRRLVGPLETVEVVR